jgi:hypothetical protein
MIALQISNWFNNGKKYKEGVELLSQNSKDKFLLKMLSGSETPFNRKKLEEKLKAILETSSKEFSVKSPEEFLSLPAEVQKLRAKTSTLFKEANGLHAQIRAWYIEMKEHPDRTEELVKSIGKNAIRIKQIFKQLDHDWYCLDYYALHGKLPSQDVKKPKKKIEEMDAFELYKYRATLRTYKSRGQTEYIPILLAVEERYKKLTNAEGAKK